MADKKKKECAKCRYKDGEKCTHESNKGIIVKYRTETPVYFRTPDELNKNGDCKNYVEFSAK